MFCLFSPERKRLGLLSLRNAAVYRTPFLIAHLRPVQDLIQGALAAAANVIAQRRAAMAGAGAFG